MIKLLSHTRQITNYRPSRAIGTIRPNDTVSMVTHGGVGGLGVYSRKVIRTHGEKQSILVICEKKPRAFIRAVSTPTQTSLSLESALSLIYGIKGNNQQSELKKRRAHGVRQRAVLLY